MALGCRECRIVRQIRPGLAEERRTYTRAFARYVLELCRYMTIKDVAVHLGVSWDIVKDIQKRHLARHYARPSLKKVRQIGGGDRRPAATGSVGQVFNLSCERDRLKTCPTAPS
ncbi:MAG TPA: transposase family protein [Pirellulaceae bacterium]|nr:transposase family protein [Pirellulaceae bacterium]